MATITLDQDVYDRLQARASGAGLTISEFLERRLEETAARERESAESKPVATDDD